MHSPGINGEGKLRGQQDNPGSPGKIAIKTECVCTKMDDTLDTLEFGHFLMSLLIVTLCKTTDDAFISI